MSALATENRAVNLGQGFPDEDGPLSVREAAARGCRTVDGLQMLLHQGVAQFRLWTGQDPPVEVMRQALVVALANRSD